MIKLSKLLKINVAAFWINFLFYYQNQCWDRIPIPVPNIFDNPIKFRLSETQFRLSPVRHNTENSPLQFFPILNSYRSQPMTQSSRWQWVSSFVPWSTRRPSTSSRSPLRANASSPTRDSPRQLQLHPKVCPSRSKRISLSRSQPLVQADSSPPHSVESNIPPTILLVCWFFMKIIRFYRKSECFPDKRSVIY